VIELLVIDLLLQALDMLLEVHYGLILVLQGVAMHKLKLMFQLHNLSLKLINLSCVDLSLMLSVPLIGFRLAGG